VTYFSWQLDGFVSWPKTFCGRRWTLKSKDIDFHEMRMNGNAGILGSGYLDDFSRFLVQLQMPPLLMQGLLEQLRQSHGYAKAWRLRSIIEDFQATPENPDILNEQIRFLREILRQILLEDNGETHPRMINIRFQVINCRPRKSVMINKTLEFDVAGISFECDEDTGE
jgi:hypothetical protein